MTTMQTKAATAAQKSAKPKVIKLPLDITGDIKNQQKLRNLFDAAYNIHRATQRDIQGLLDIYDEFRSGKYYQSLPKVDPNPPKKKGEKRNFEDEIPWRGNVLNNFRNQIGLNSFGVIDIAKKHHTGAKHLQKWFIQDVASAHGSQIWESINRHIFPDKTGKYFGRPKITYYYNFTKINGRAKGQTAWSTFKIVGDFEATLRGDRHEDHALPPVKRNARDWTHYHGPLLFVSNRGDFIIPVKLPTGSGQLARLKHFLSNQELWHKVNLIRIQDYKAPNGWRYEAHLLVNIDSYASPATVIRRAEYRSNRIAGCDTNVSNVSVASRSEDFIEYSYVKPTPAQVERGKLADEVSKKRRRKSDRSRRANNPEQYGENKAQKRANNRRKKKGQKAKNFQLRKGARKSSKNGKPLNSYKNDSKSKSYERNLSKLRFDENRMTMRKDFEAKDLAIHLITLHGIYWIIENCNMSTWQRLWGKAMRATTPGRLVNALEAELAASNGWMKRAVTVNTAMSQTCVCSDKEKKPLSQRVHACGKCGLHSDRDLLSALLATTVEFDKKNSTLGLSQVELAKVSDLLRGNEGLLFRSTAEARQVSCLFSADEGNREPHYCESLALSGSGSVSGTITSAELNIHSGQPHERNSGASKKRRRTVSGKPSSRKKKSSASTSKSPPTTYE